MSDITNVELGVADVNFKTAPLGYTKGGASFRYEPKIKDVTVDQHGETTMRKILVGEKLTVKVVLAESTIANFLVAIPGADDQTTYLGIGNAGADLGDEAGALYLHPRAMGTDFSQDLYVPKAVVHSAVEVPFQVEGERLLEVEFDAILDEATGRLAYIGDYTDIV